jgi:DNA-binding CsgD family transcriptional regulator
MQQAGKSDKEISKMLSITPLTIQYLANLFQKSESIDVSKLSGDQEQRTELVHEMVQAGKGYAEISEMLQISISRVRQIVHRHAWNLRQPKSVASAKH